MDWARIAIAVTRRSKLETLLLMDRLASASVRRRRSNHIGLMRLDAVGDYFLWRRSARDLIEHYRGREQQVVLIGNEAWAEFAASDLRIPLALVINRRKFGNDLRYRWRVVRQLCSLGLDTIISPVFSRELLCEDALVRVSGARNRIGFSGDLSNEFAGERARGDGWYSSLVPAATAPLMEIARNREFVLNFLGQRGDDLHSVHFEVSCDLHCPLDLPTDYVVVVPGASRATKRWPVDKFAALANRLLEFHKLNIVICGSPDEVGLARQIEEKLPDKVLNLTGRTNLKTLVGIIKRAQLVVANDTSAIHIASALNVPSLAIVGGGHFGRFLPYEPSKTDNVAPIPVYRRMPCYGCNWQCRFPSRPGEPFPCIEEVSVDDAWHAVQVILTS